MAVRIVSQIVDTTTLSRYLATCMWDEEERGRPLKVGRLFSAAIPYRMAPC